MTKGVDRLIAYKTMRAVQDQAERDRARGGKPPTRWQRWQDAVTRFVDKLLG